MPIDFRHIRYREDCKDVKKLTETYSIHNNLEMVESKRQDDYGFRKRWLKDVIKFTSEISSKIYRLYKEVCETLELEATDEVFCLPSFMLSAYAYLNFHKSGVYSPIEIISEALEKLEDQEIKFFIGHELGYIIFADNRPQYLINNKEDNSKPMILLPFAESLFLRWQKMNLSKNIAHRVAIGAAQAVGFEVDIQLNKLSIQFKEQIKEGLEKYRSN